MKQLDFGEMKIHVAVFCIVTPWSEAIGSCYLTLKMEAVWPSQTMASQHRIPRHESSSPWKPQISYQLQQHAPNDGSCRKSLHYRSSSCKCPLQAVKCESSPQQFGRGRTLTASFTKEAPQWKVIWG